MSRITRKKINDIKVTVPKYLLHDEEPPSKGMNLFPIYRFNCFICAPKGSGKTSLIRTIILRCCDRDTTVIVFSSTVNNDKMWLDIKHQCKVRGIPFQGFDSMYEQKGRTRVNRLKALVDTIKRMNQYDEEDEEVIEQKGGTTEDRRDASLDDMFDGDPLESEEDFGTDEDEEQLEDADVEWFGTGNRATDKKIMKATFPRRDDESQHHKPFKTPKYMFILDDLSKELKDPDLEFFVRTCRHPPLNAACVISSQYPHDCLPGTLKQMQYFLLLRGFAKKKIEKIAEDAGLNVDPEDLLRLYNYATHDKFHFLYVDATKKEFRKDFDELLTLHGSVE